MRALAHTLVCLWAVGTAVAQSGVNPSLGNPTAVQPSLGNGGVQPRQGGNGGVQTSQGGNGGVQPSQGGNGGVSPSLGSPDPPIPTDQAIQLTGFEDCRNTLKIGTGFGPEFINAAWQEFQKMVPQGPYTDPDHPLGRPRYDWLDWKSAPAVEFFGPAGTHQTFRNAVWNNLDSLSNARNGWLVKNLHVRCDDPLKLCLNPGCNPCSADYAECMKRPKAGRTAYVDPSDDTINFCYRFFTLEHLDNRIDRIANTPDQRDSLSNYQINRAFSFAHELMHISWIGKAVPPYNFPNIPDMATPFGRKAYSVLDTKLLTYDMPVGENVNKSGEVWTSDFAVHG